MDMLSKFPGCFSYICSCVMMYIYGRFVCWYKREPTEWFGADHGQQQFG